MQIATIFAIIAIVLGYLYARPQIIVEKINPINRNPFLHEFIIQNSGKMPAKNLRIEFLNPNVITTNNITFGTYGDKTKDATISGWSPIEEIDVPPGQTYSFIPMPGLPLEKYQIKQATLTLKFKYKDFLKISYNDRFAFHTVLENGIIVWKPISKKYQEFVDSN